MILLLAVFVAAGMSQSGVQAVDLTAKMMTASDMGDPGCQACPTGSTDGMKALFCGVICTTPILAVLLQPSPVILSYKPMLFMTQFPLLHGSSSPPDPYPPKPTDIG